MAFFTRVSLNVPVLPPEESANEPHHRRYASEPTTSTTKVSNNFVSAQTKCASQPGVPQKTVSVDSKSEPEGSTEDKINDDEPKRYEYVVDRVLGVEV